MNIKQKQLFENILKGDKIAQLDFFQEFKVGNFPHTKDTYLEKEIDKEDLFMVDLSPLDDETLIRLHQFTNWNSPSLFLRTRYFNNLAKASDEVLIILLQCKSELAKKELKNRYKNNMSDANDEILVLMCQDKIDLSMDFLIERYHPFVKKIINRLQRKYFFRGFDANDLFQEGILGLFKAIDDFKVERKTRFKDFSKHVIEKHIKTLILKSSNYKNKVLNESFSYHTPIGGDSEITFEQLLKSDSYAPENSTEKKEIFYDIWSKFTKLEKEVLHYRSIGLSYEEIGEKVGKNKKAIDNTIQRFRKKGEDYLENNYGVKKL